MRAVFFCTAVWVVSVCSWPTIAEESQYKVDGDQLLERFFAAETEKVTRQALADIHSEEDWQAKRPIYLEQLKEMLGLSPWPDKTDLNATTTGTAKNEGIVAEKVHYQSMPGMYVTGTFFRPEVQTAPLPAVLYVCGHGRVKENGVSYGNKATYQHHGAWFAQNGYVCLMIDTIQLGEIEGIHHGTYREEMWWWHNHGYTPAGVEAWNGIRAIDYLQSRPEVDGDKIGITGRSGGGAYSWWVAALDERIKVAVPVAGITSMQNHIVDGCIEGHCDCMYMVNTYAWDFPILAAMVAPRPLLISNTDKDRIFPLDGVVDVYQKALRIYEFHDAVGNIGLNIAEGPHKDTQELRINAFHWFNRFLKEEDPLIEIAATKLFTPEELKVFDELPEDERVTSIQESFIPLADEALPETQAELDALQERVVKKLRETTFRNVDLDANPELKKYGSWNSGQSELTMYSYNSDSVYDLPMLVLKAARDVPTDSVHFVVCDQVFWEKVKDELAAGFPECPYLDSNSDQEWTKTREFKYLNPRPNVCRVYCLPRGIGPTAWDASAKQEIHIKRRVALLGHTIDSLRTYDVYQCLRALRAFSPKRVEMEATGYAANWGLMASILSPGVDQVVLDGLGCDFQDGPFLLGISQTATKSQVILTAIRRAKHLAILNEPDRQSECHKNLSSAIKRLFIELQ